MDLSATSHTHRHCLWRRLASAVSPALLLALGACSTQAQMANEANEKASPKVYTQVAAGNTHACALVSDGTVVCWGWNKHGQLGNGATYDRGDGNSLSGMFLYGLREATGQPGDGSSLPVAVSGLSGATAISAGGDQTCALLKDDAVMCWGGSPLRGVSNVPVAIKGLMGAVTAISVGGGHACALLGSGGVQCWGANDYGQLGIGAYNHWWVAIDQGETASGQPGNGRTTESNTPMSVTGLAGAATAISTGSVHTCALIKGGTVQCWGLNDSGQLGNGTTTDLTWRERGSSIISSTPATVVGLKGATAISKTCALLSGGAVQCWGGDSSTPVTVTGLTDATAASAAEATAISVGGGHRCAVLSDGTAKCWGSGGYGQLGNGAFNDSKTPVTVTGLTGATAISLGQYFSCALRRDGSIWCWGRNYQGELGDGSYPANRSTAASVRNCCH